MPMPVCDLPLLLRRLAAEREAGEARVAAERRAIDAKVAKVRATLAERYEAGFKPLLAEAEARHLAELQVRMKWEVEALSSCHAPSSPCLLQRVVDLQKELEAREAELRSAHEASQAVSAAVLAVAGGGSSAATPGSPEGAAANAVPQWKLTEFEELRAAVSSMWEQLDVPPEDVTAFLSECDLLAPFSPAVLALYQVRGGERRRCEPDSHPSLPPLPRHRTCTAA